VSLLSRVWIPATGGSDHSRRRRRALSVQYLFYGHYPQFCKAFPATFVGAEAAVLELVPSIGEGRQIGAVGGHGVLGPSLRVADRITSGYRPLTKADRRLLSGHCYRSWRRSQAAQGYRIPNSTRRYRWIGHMLNTGQK
jgi:hypothetical protein